MFILYLLELLITTLFIIGLVTEVIIPVMSDVPVFPTVRRWGLARKAAKLRELHAQQTLAEENRALGRDLNQRQSRRTTGEKL